MDVLTGLLPRLLSSATISPVETGRGVQRSTRARSRSRADRQALDEPLFRDVLIREWRRADRFDQSFVLVLVASRSSEPTAWPAVIGAVTALKRDTDVVGWFEHNKVIGLLRPDSDAFGPVPALELESQVRREIEDRLSSELAASLSVGVHVPVVLERVGDVAGPDPLFEELRGGRGQSAPRDRGKRLLDIAGSLGLLIFLLPCLLLVSLLVKLTSRGPVFFRQTRVGASGRPFKMLKFRTMHVDADHEPHRQFVTSFIKAGDALTASEGSGLFKIVNDPRVTFIGRILRKTSLDELPQLWNVLRGDMSLVGPRPPLAYEVEQYKRWHLRRVLEAKPGMTGLWQVTGRSRTTFDEMVRLDLRYVQNQSAWTDIKILLATPRAVISGKGAC